MIQMKTTNKLAFILSFVSIILLFNTFTYANAAEAPWADGSMFTWGYEDSTIMHTIDYEHDTESIVESRSSQIFTYNLTDVDNSTLTYDYDIFTSSGGGSGTSSYDVQLYTNQISLGNMFFVNYVWDFEHNVTVMNGFTFTAPVWQLVDPNWTAINSRFVDVLNGSILMDTVVDPYQPITYNITLNDVLNDATSFSIMGKSTLQEAKQQFTPSIRSWTFEFDYSNVVKIGIFNVTAGYNNYYNYEKLTESVTMEYTSEGVLQQYVENGEQQSTIDDYMLNIWHNVYYNLGGYTVTDTSPLVYLMVIPAIACMVIFVKWMNKRKI